MPRRIWGFTAYELLTKRTESDGKPTPVGAMANGAWVGSVEGVAWSPTKMLSAIQHTADVKQTTCETARSVVKEHGVLGLWRGAMINAVRSSASGSAYFGALAVTAAVLPKRNSAIEGAVAGATATLLTSPIDIVLSRAYIERAKSSGVTLSGRDIAEAILQRHGPRGFFRGVSAAVVRAGPAAAVSFTVTRTCFEHLMADAPTDA